MKVGYYHEGTIGNAEVVKAITAAGHMVFQRSADYFKESEKSFDAVVVDKGVKLEGYLAGYAGKPVVSAETFMSEGFGGEQGEQQTPAKPAPEPEKAPEGEPKPEKEPEGEPEPEKGPFNPDEPSKPRGKRKQG